MQENLAKSGHLTIDLKALADNYRLFQEQVGANCQVAGVVKADAYGLGLKPVVEKLTALNCPQFFVATLDEALQVRQVNSETPVAVLGGLFHGAEKEYIENNIMPVLNTPEEILRYAELSKNENQKLPAIIHFDTGMNRLGLSADETKDLIDNQDRIDGIDTKYIMSHFVSADDAHAGDENGQKITALQASRFADIAKHFPDIKKSLANSPGLFRDKNYHYDMTRPGFSLYGGNPTPEQSNPVRRVVDLSVRILQIRLCKKGESIGYGASHVFEKDTVTATAGMGYADGFLRSGSNKAMLYYNGAPCPVIGRVSMDLVTVDLSALQTPPQASESLEVLGPHQSVDDLAAAAGTIGYEVLTSLGKRYAREYI